MSAENDNPQEPLPVEDDDELLNSEDEDNKYDIPFRCHDEKNYRFLSDVTMRTGRNARSAQLD